MGKLDGKRRLRDDQTKSIPIKRIGKPEKVAKVALFQATEDADGSTYVIDGGLMQNIGQGA